MILSIIVLSLVYICVSKVHNKNMITMQMSVQGYAKRMMHDLSLVHLIAFGPNNPICLWPVNVDK